MTQLDGQRLRTPFDRALELRALRDAAHAYAAKRGEPGSASYRRAWLTFRQRIQSIEDLTRWRASAANGTPRAREHSPVMRRGAASHQSYDTAGPRGRSA